MFLLFLGKFSIGQTKAWTMARRNFQVTSIVIKFFPVFEFGAFPSELMHYIYAVTDFT